MAIRRCPYCKTIIDEQDKYCNNCGTQLLFPEDEYVEEEIPGDKIIDEEEEEEEEDGEEELLEEKPEETAEDAEEEEEKKEEAREEKTSEELEEPEEEPREEDLEEEKGREEEGETEETSEHEGEEEESGGEEEEEDLGGKRPLDSMMPADIAGEDIDEEEREEDDELEEILERASGESEEEVDKKYHVSIEKDELIFRTKDLDDLTGTVDKGKEELEERLEDFQEKREDTKKLVSDTGEVVPPWLSGMKGGAPTDEVEEEDEEEEQEREQEEEEKEEVEETTAEVEEEKPPTRPEWTTDSGIGIPEKVTQSGLPFKDSAALEEGGEREMAVEEERSIEREAPRRRRFSLRLKAKLIDLVFIAALWLISLWFTSQVVGVSFFRLITGSTGPVLAFFFILLLLYFFLFLYFLGETLGDHYFSPED